MDAYESYDEADFLPDDANTDTRELLKARRKESYETAKKQRKEANLMLKKKVATDRAAAKAKKDEELWVALKTGRPSGASQEDSE